MAESYGEGLEKEVLSAFKQGHMFIDGYPYLEDALLTISGVQTKQELLDFKERISSLTLKKAQELGIIASHNGYDKEETFKKQYYHLQRKKRTYKKSFRLSEFILSLEHPNPKVGIGNCSGLIAGLAVETIRYKRGYFLNLLLEHNHVLGRIDRGKNNPIILDLTVNGAFVDTPQKKLEYYQYRRYHSGEQMAPDEQVAESFFKNRFEDAALRCLIPCFLNNRGCEKATEEKNYGGAIGDFTKAIDIYPKCSMALINRGLINFLNLKDDEAEEDFNTALKIFPGNSNIYLNLGAVHLRRALRLKNTFKEDECQEHFFKAEHYLDTALDIDKFNSEAYYHRWLLRDSIGDKENAKYDWRSHLQYKTRDPCEHTDEPDEQEKFPFPHPKKKVAITIPKICPKDKERKITGAKEFFVVHLSPYIYSAKNLMNKMIGKSS